MCELLVARRSTFSQQFRNMRNHRRYRVFCLLAVMLCAARQVGALKFVMVPMNANSPALDLMAVAAKLTERGHQVAVVVSDLAVDYMKKAAARHSSNTTGEAIKYISVDIGLPATEGQTLDLAQMRKNMMDRYSAPTTFWQSLMIGPRMLYLMRGHVANPCRHVLGNPQTYQALKGFRPDAILAVSIPITAAGVSDNCGCMIAHALNTTFIDLFWSPQTSLEYNVPQYASGFSPADLKSPVLYAKNLAMWAVQRVAMPLWEAVYPDNMAAVRKELGLPQAEAQCLAKRVYDRLKGVPTKKCESLKEVQLYNWLLEYPSTLKANQVLVGPGTPRPAHPIQPPEVAKFVEHATSGLALVAFGSTVQSAALLTPQDVYELTAVFNSLAPMRVLLAMGDGHLPGGLRVKDLALHDNVMTVPWVDYNDVLGHPHTMIIISHGGGHSVHEAAFHGIPMVVIPFMYDSAVEYAKKYVDRGAGLICYQAPAFRRNKPDMTYTRQHVLQLIQKVLTDPSYAKAATAIALGLQMYAKHRHPYDRAADEIELALYTHYAQQGIDMDALSEDINFIGSRAVAVGAGSCMATDSTAGSSRTAGAVAVDSGSCHDGEVQQQQQQQQHEEL